MNNSTAGEGVDKAYQQQTLKTVLDQGEAVMSQGEKESKHFNSLEM